MKPRYKSKTYWFALSLAVLGAVEMALPSARHLIPAEYYPYLLVGVSVAVALLREVTREPVGKA